jgi:hypothetical protein
LPDLPSNHFDNEGLVGAAAWAVSIGLIAAYLSRGSWYDPMSFDQKIQFGLAVGTAALAVANISLVVTAWVARRSDERRHGQSVAPLVRIELAMRSKPKSMVGLVARNVGLGPALHISVIAWHDASASEPLADNISALAIGDKRKISDSVTEQPRPPDRTFYRRVTVRYEDVYGNEYATVYRDFGQLRYEYHRPKKLRPS